MKILHVYVYHDLGGIENATRDSFAGLEQRGHENVLLYGGMRLEDLERIGRKTYYWPEANDFYRRSTGLVEMAAAILDQEAPDAAVVHTPLDGALVKSLWGRVPVLYYAHNYGSFCPSGAQLYQRDDSVCQLDGVPDARCIINAYVRRCNTRRPGKLLELYRRAKEFGAWAREADGVLCGSEFMARRLAANGFAKDRLHVVYYPVRQQEGRPTTLQSTKSSTDGSILFAGRISPEKGLDYLVRALPKLSRPWGLTVAGSGPDTPTIRALAEKLHVGDRVKFLGRLNREDLSQAYAGASVVVVPSVWPEPFGMVGPEALAHGVPVVAFDSGGIPEWLPDGEVGYLVQSRDVESMAERIEAVLSNPALGSQLGTKGRMLVAERFSIEKHVDRLLEAFRHAAEVRRRSRVQPM